MDRLGEMEAFLHVVDQGGFTGAADRIGISKSAVSKHISALEARLGARLLNRTTRRVSPTEIGLLYYDRVRQVLSEAQEADEMVSAHQESPRGTLRLSAPVSFGVRHVSPALVDFLCAYPDISVSLELDDRVVDLVSSGFDAAIRIGKLVDSSLRARKLAETDMILVASPDYLAKHGTPERIEDLSDHNLLHYSFLSTGNSWRFVTKTGEERHIRFGGRFAANNGDVLLDTAIGGHGIVYTPCFFLRDELETGKLVQILKEHRQGPVGVHMVYPPGRFVQPKTRVFIDFMVERFKGYGPLNWNCAKARS